MRRYRIRPFRGFPVLILIEFAMLAGSWLRINRTLHFLCVSILQTVQLQCQLLIECMTCGGSIANICFIDTSLGFHFSGV